MGKLDFINLLLAFDVIGTVSFAVSGALVAIREKMDILGVNILAVVTATGGGVLRDILMGKLPPVVFSNPMYVGIAVVTANIVFTVAWFHPQPPKALVKAYNRIMVLFDTVGVAAFTMDGVIIGSNLGYWGSLFPLVILGSITGVGGGIIRDILATRIPDVLRKHVYALAAMAGALTAGVIMLYTDREAEAVIAGFAVVVILRLLAIKYNWNLPKIE